MSLRFPIVFKKINFFFVLKIRFFLFVAIKIKPPTLMALEVFIGG